MLHQRISWYKMVLQGGERFDKRLPKKKIYTPGAEHVSRDNLRGPADRGVGIGERKWVFSGGKLEPRKGIRIGRVTQIGGDARRYA